MVGLCLIAALARMPFLTADPPGLYFNSDEGHQNSDARSVALGGSVFDDPYTPAVPMPVFSAIKALVMKVCGVSLVSVRAPSVCFSALGALCMALLWRRRPLAAWVTAALLGVPFYFFVHARFGIHEPILFGLSALQALLFARAIDRDSRGAYIAAGALVPLIVLTKPSGIYVIGTVGLTLLVLAWRERRIDWKHLAGGAAAGALIAAAVWLFWLQPHRDALAAFVDFEVGRKATPALKASAFDFGERLFRLSPALAVGAALALCITLYRVLLAPARLSSAELILAAWFVSASAGLFYSQHKPARWFLWVLPAAAAMSGMVAQQLVDALRPRHWPRARVYVATLACLVVALAAADARNYRETFARRSFYIRDNTAAVESFVQDHPVTGSGLESFSANSGRIRLLSAHHSDLGDCEGWEAAFGGREPVFVSRWVGRDPAARIEREGLGVVRLVSGCATVNESYRPYLIVTNYPGNSRLPHTYNLWFVRRDHAAPRVPDLPSQLRALEQLPVTLERLNPSLR